jgi:hypothetical protein
MTLIKIKFNSEMERAIIEGRKCCTTRDEIKGNIGDLFRVKDRMYRIIQVDESDLFYSSAMANAEGFKSDIEYLDCMSEIYPDLVECSPVFIHYFAYAGPWCPQFGVNGAVCSVPERLCDTGFDAEAVRVCFDIEAIARKHNVGVMDVMNRVMQVHCTWEGR